MSATVAQMMTRALVLLSCLLGLLGGLAQAATYHVRTNGTQSACGSIQGGIGAGDSTNNIQTAVSCMSAVGDRVDIHAGTYTVDSDGVTFPRSGASGQPLVVQNFGYTGTRGSGDAVEIRTPWTLQNWKGAFQIEDLSYITIQGLTFANSCCGWAIHTFESDEAAPYAVHHIQVLNNTVHDWGQDDLTATTSLCSGALPEQCGVDNAIAAGGDSNLIEGNLIYNSYGIGISAGPINCTIRNNTVHDMIPRMVQGNGTFRGEVMMTGGSFCGGGGSGCIIEGNTWYNLPSNDGWASKGFWCDVQQNNGIVRNNVAHDIQGRGIEIEWQCNNWNVYNNVVHHTRIGISSASFATGDNVNLTIDNNTVYSIQQIGIGLQHLSGTKLVRNNIVMDADINLYTSGYAVANGTTTFQNNLSFSSSGGNHWTWNNTTNNDNLATKVSHATWTSNSGETGGKNQNPLFVSVSIPDLHLQSGSPAIGAGLNLSGIFTTDAEGNTRSVPFDMGAYEFGTAGTPPSFTFSASPNPVVVSGGTSVLSWSAISNCAGGSCTCTASVLGGQADSGWTGVKSTGASGTYTTQVRTASTTYQLSCADTSTSLTTPHSVTVTLPAALLGHWPLHETIGGTATDVISGQNGALRTGTTDCSPPTAGCPTWGVNQLNLNGTSGYVNVPRTTALEPTSGMSVCAWVTRTGAQNPYTAVVDKTYQNDSSSPFCSYGFQVNAGGVGSDRISFITGHAGGVDQLDSGSGALPLNTPTHVCGTWDGAEKILYIMGVPGTPKAVSGALTYDTTATGNLIFGAHGSNGGAYFLGALADVRVYSGALTPAEVLTAMVSYPVMWPMNNGSGTVASDVSGNGFDGTLCDGATCPATGGTGPSWITGQVLGAIRCDGSNDNIQVSNNAGLNLNGDMTLQFWLRLVSTANLANNPVIFTKEDVANDFAAPGHVELRHVGAPNPVWYHHTNGGNFSAQLDFTSAVLTTNTWYYLAFVRTMTSPARTVTLYVNGSPVQNISWAGATPDDPQATTTPLLMCASSDRAIGRYANVDLDEIRFYNTARTQAQIQADMGGGTPPAAPTNLRVLAP